MLEDVEVDSGGQVKACGRFVRRVEEMSCQKSGGPRQIFRGWMLPLQHLDKGLNPGQGAAIDGAGLVGFEGECRDCEFTLEQDIFNLAEAEGLGVVNNAV